MREKALIHILVIQKSSEKEIADLSLHSVNRDDTDHEKLTSHPFHITFIDKKLAAVKVSSYL